MNQTASDSGFPSAANPTDKLVFGARSDSGSLFVSGDIFEIIIYDKTLSQSERNEIRSYIIKKYGL